MVIEKRHIIRRRTLLALVGATISFGALWAGMTAGPASAAPTGRVTPREWRLEHRLEAALVAEFDLWEHHEPGAQRACVPLRGERSTLAALTTSRAWRTIGRRLHLLALQALDLKGWGVDLAGRAHHYHAASARARMASASRLIADGADDLYLALSDLANAYGDLAAWKCDQTGLYLAAGGELGLGRVALDRGFARIPLAGARAH
jgi:hypothetical protein